MQKIKEYAESKNISCEAVRKKIRFYRDELGEHVYKKGRAQYLDDTAIEFLDEHSVEKPVVVYDAQKDEEIKGLQVENKHLHQQLIQIQQDYLQSQEHAHALEIEKLRIEGAQERAEEKIKNLESAAEQAGAELEQAQVERNRANEKMEHLQTRRLTIRERITGRLQAVDAE